MTAMTELRLPAGKLRFTNHIDEVVLVTEDGGDSNLAQELRERHGIPVHCMAAEEVKKRKGDPSFQEEIASSIIIIDKPTFSGMTANDVFGFINSGVSGVPSYTRLKEDGSDEVWEFIDIVAHHRNYQLSNAA